MIMAKLRDCLPSSLQRITNRNDLRMELEEFLEIWDCSDQEIEDISGRYNPDEIRDFGETPDHEAYQFGLIHSLWSRQATERIEQGEYQEEFKIPEPLTPTHKLWSELDELYSFNLTPREFKTFWNITNWQLARILKADIAQVEKYLKSPAKASVPPLVCFFLGYLHHQWIVKMGQSLSSPSVRIVRVLQNPSKVPMSL